MASRISRGSFNSLGLHKIEARGSNQACWDLLALFKRMLLTQNDRNVHYPLSALHELQKMYRLSLERGRRRDRRCVSSTPRDDRLECANLFLRGDRWRDRSACGGTALVRGTAATSTSLREAGAGVQRSPVNAHILRLTPYSLPRGPPCSVFRGKAFWQPRSALRTKLKDVLGPSGPNSGAARLCCRLRGCLAETAFFASVLATKFIQNDDTRIPGHVIGWMTMRIYNLSCHAQLPETECSRFQIPRLPRGPHISNEVRVFLKFAGGTGIGVPS